MKFKQLHLKLDDSALDKAVSPETLAKRQQFQGASRPAPPVQSSLKGRTEPLDNSRWPQLDQGSPANEKSESGVQLVFAKWARPDLQLHVEESPLAEDLPEASLSQNRGSGPVQSRRRPPNDLASSSQRPPLQTAPVPPPAPPPFHSPKEKALSAAHSLALKWQPLSCKNSSKKPGPPDCPRLALDPPRPRRTDPPPALPASAAKRSQVFKFDQASVSEALRLKNAQALSCKNTFHSPLQATPLNSNPDSRQSRHAPPAQPKPGVPRPPFTPQSNQVLKKSNTFEGRGGEGPCRKGGVREAPKGSGGLGQPGKQSAHPSHKRWQLDNADERSGKRLPRADRDARPGQLGEGRRGRESLCAVGLKSRLNCKSAKCFLSSEANCPKDSSRRKSALAEEMAVLRREAEAQAAVKVDRVLRESRLKIDSFKRIVESRNEALREREAEVRGLRERNRLLEVQLESAKEALNALARRDGLADPQASFELPSKESAADSPQDHLLRKSLPLEFESGPPAQWSCESPSGVTRRHSELGDPARTAQADAPRHDLYSSTPHPSNGPCRFPPRFGSGSPKDDTPRLDAKDGNDSGASSTHPVSDKTVFQNRPNLARQHESELQNLIYGCLKKRQAEGALRCDHRGGEKGGAPLFRPGHGHSAKAVKGTGNASASKAEANFFVTSKKGGRHEGSGDRGKGSGKKDGGDGHASRWRTSGGGRGPRGAL